jgi:hypothetical protein
MALLLATEIVEIIFSPFLSTGLGYPVPTSYTTFQSGGFTLIFQPHIISFLIYDSPNAPILHIVKNSSSYKT